MILSPLARRHLLSSRKMLQQQHLSGIERSQKSAGFWRQKHKINDWIPAFAGMTERP